MALEECCFIPAGSAQQQPLGAVWAGPSHAAECDLGMKSIQHCTGAHYCLSRESPIVIRNLPVQGPDLDWLHRLWDLALELLCGGTVSAERLQADLTSLGALDAWPLIPLASGLLHRVADRFTVFTPPIRQHTVSTPQPADSHAASSAEPLDSSAANPAPRSEGADSTSTHEQTGSKDEAPEHEKPDHPASQEVLGLPEHDDAHGVWAWLLPLVRHLGLPLLDAEFAPLGPLCEGLRAATPADKILNKLRLCAQRGFFEVGGCPACKAAGLCSSISNGRAILCPDLHQTS